MSEIVRVYHGSHGGLQGAIRPESDSSADFGSGFFDGPMTMMELDLCDVQGKLFQLAATSGYDPVAFVDVFMQSKVAEGLDSDYNRLQWSGEVYILHRLEEETALAKGGEAVDPEALFWAGYICRYWHFATGESSRDIHAIADAKRLLTVYPGYHTLDCDFAIKKLKGTA